MKILILSNTSWAMDNSFGNSFSNIFGNMNNIEIANIYCRYGEPDNDIVKRYFQITEKTLIKNIINRNYPSGRVIEKDENVDELENTGLKVFNHGRKRRYQIYFWARDLIWKVGRWKSPDLINFINDFNPDIIFQPLYYSNYLNTIVMFLKKHTHIPMVCYVSDDVYTMKQFSLSPLFWIDRLIKRRKIRNVVKLCEHLYVISEIQKNEYEKIFKKECKILTKGADFSLDNNIKKEFNNPIKLIFTGNISDGRWESLSFIARALEEINKEGIKAQLLIYSTTPITMKMKNSLLSEGNVFFMGGVSSQIIPSIQKDSDILVHVESTRLKERFKVRHSFSTKIVDYFNASRCIFAVGKDDVASIDYLLNEDAAIVAHCEEDVFVKLNKLINDEDLIVEYANKAWECGRRNHQIKEIQNELYNDLESLVEDGKNENIKYKCSKRN